jgi:hypothetical protein
MANPDVDLLLQVHAPAEEDEDEQEGSEDVVTNTFAPYVPKKLGFGGDHPDPVVETTSLAAVEPPNITYKLHLDVRLLWPSQFPIIWCPLLVFLFQFQFSEHLNMQILCGSITRPL